MKLAPIVLLLSLSLARSVNADDAQPNMLFIAVDDLNDYISPLDNQAGIETPNFDRLARQSVTFANAHCVAPACHASRVAVMTGVLSLTSFAFAEQLSHAVSDERYRLIRYHDGLEELYDLQDDPHHVTACPTNRFIL